MPKVCRKHRIEFNGLRCPACTAAPTATSRHSSEPEIQNLPVPRTPESDRIREKMWDKEAAANKAMQEVVKVPEGWKYQSDGFVAHTEFGHVRQEAADRWWARCTWRKQGPPLGPFEGLVEAINAVLFDYEFLKDPGNRLAQGQPQ
jgi:hypothetical protein